MMTVKTFTIHSPDSIAIVRDKLRQQIDDPPSPFEFLKSKDYFCGEVSDDGFRLYRLIKNAHWTIVSGEFEEVSGGTIIHAIVKLNPKMIIINLLILVVWYFFARYLHEIADNEMIDDINLPMVIISLIISMIIYLYVNEPRFYKQKLTQALL